jgi:thiol-disulfide isomerase/thioredoxin
MYAVRVAALVAALTAASLTASAAMAPTPGAGNVLVPATAADVLQAVRAPGASAALVNVWASWCVPCREEMPDLLRLRSAYAGRGLRFILVSGDFSSDAAQATAFLREQGVDFPSYIRTGSDSDLIDALDPQWSGALPATFIFDAKGHLQRAIHGKGSYDQFEAKIRDVLATPH